MRSIERTVGCSINTVDKLLRDAGETALAYHDEHIRGVKATRVQCDEVLEFCRGQAEEPAPEQGVLLIRPPAIAGPGRRSRPARSC